MVNDETLGPIVRSSDQVDYVYDAAGRLLDTITHQSSELVGKGLNNLDDQYHEDCHDEW